MKHLATLLLALGLSAASVTAQNVTVMMKDGTSHKFNADRLSELKFRDASQEQRMDVTFLQPDITAYSGGNASLSFKNAEGTVELVTDIYGPEDAAWLNQGTYTLSADNTPYTIDPAWSSLKINGEEKTITAAEMYVSYGPQIDEAARRREQATNPDRFYTIQTVITTSDDIKVYGTYIGALSSYTPWLTLTLNKASYNENPQQPGDFYVKFNDADWKCEMAIVFSADAQAQKLPAGTYTLSDVRMPNTISSASYVDLYSPNANLKLNPGSVVNVALDGDVYTIDMNLNLSDGRTGEFTFTGEITGTPTFETEEPEYIELTEVKTFDVYSGGNVTVGFCTSDNASRVELDMYGPTDAVYMTPGIYTASTGNEPFTFDPSMSDFRVGDSGSKNPTGGTVEVSYVEGSLTAYTFKYDLTCDDGTEFHAIYTGNLPEYTRLIELTLSKASYNENPQQPGDFYVKFNDANWKCEMALVFTAEATETTLPAGNYVYSDTRAAGTVSPASYVDLYSPNANLKLAEGSEVTVTRDGDTYTIDMNLNFNDGRFGQFTYTGQITGTPTFDTPEPEYIELTEVKTFDVYGGGNVTIGFRTSDNATRVELDMYGPTDATSVMPGTYTASEDNEPFTFDPSMSDFRQDYGDIKNPTGGTVVVSIEEGTQIYTFKYDLTCDDGTEFHAIYTGELPAYEMSMPAGAKAEKKSVR